MKNGHVLDAWSMVCKLCGATYQSILDGGEICTPTPLLIDKLPCIECTLIREVFSTVRGWTCQECIDQIRKDGAALHNILNPNYTAIAQRRYSELSKSVGQTWEKAFDNVDWANLFDE